MRVLAFACLLQVTAAQRMPWCDSYSRSACPCGKPCNNRRPGRMDAGQCPSCPAWDESLDGPMAPNSICDLFVPQKFGGLDAPTHYDKTPWPCNNNADCRICHRNGCDQCKDYHFKLDYHYPCLPCQALGCRNCQDKQGCSQYCLNGASGIRRCTIPGGPVVKVCTNDCDAWVRDQQYNCKLTVATDAPVTAAPMSRPPTTFSPTTEAPTTQTPTTLSPTTEAPTTEAPTTEAPTTQAPKTQAPKTQAPKTQAPKTQAPKTQAPKTQAPKTQAPKDDVCAVGCSRNSQCGPGKGMCKKAGLCCSQHGWCGKTGSYCNGKSKTDYNHNPTCSHTCITATKSPIEPEILPIGASGDPFVTDARGNKIQLFLPLDRDVTLLTCKHFQLLGHVMASGIEGDHQQWFNRFLVNVDGAEKLSVAVREEGAMRRVSNGSKGAEDDKDIDGVGVEPATPKNTTKGQSLDMITVGIDGSKVRVTTEVVYDGVEIDVSHHKGREIVHFAADGVSMDIKTSLASKFPSKTLQMLYRHLDLSFATLDTALCAGGVLAEVWGLVPMSGATSAMLNPQD